MSTAEMLLLVAVMYAAPHLVWYIAMPISIILFVCSLIASSNPKEDDYGD